MEGSTRTYDAVSLTLHPHPQAVATARRFAASVTAGQLDESGQRDLGVLVSEVVTNGVVHAATTMELIVGSHDGNVRVELVDHSPGEPHIRSEGVLNTKSWSTSLISHADASNSASSWPGPHPA